MALVIFFLLNMLLSITYACSPGGAGNLMSDAEIIQDPELVFSLSPPVGWTYFPPISGIGNQQQLVNFFPGQGLSLNDASQRAAADVTAAMLEAFNEVGILAPGIEITVVYEPDMISNCYIGQIIQAGTKIGVLSGGAITEIGLVPNQGVTLAACSPITGIEFMEYVKDVRVVIRGYTASRYVWNRISSSMLATLNFRYHALFRSPILITR